MEQPASQAHDSAREGSPPPPAAVFADRFQESFQLLWTIAAGITNDRSIAEDVVQEAAMIALEKLDDFKPGTNFVAWMAQTVRFVALNTARREQKRRGLNLDDVRVVDNSRPPADSGIEQITGAEGRVAPDQPHLDDTLVAALERETDIARACLLLRTLQGLEYGEIAAALGIPEGTAMSHVHRARYRLREALRVTRDVSDNPPKGSA